MKIKPGILVIKGNFTQRQFDALNQIWVKLQEGQDGEDVDKWSLPCIQLSQYGDIGIMQLQSDGTFYMNSVFGSDCNCCEENNDSESKREAYITISSNGDITLGKKKNKEVEKNNE